MIGEGGDVIILYVCSISEREDELFDKFGLLCNVDQNIIFLI